MFSALTTLAQGYDYTYTAPTVDPASSGFSPITALIWLAVTALVVVAMWKVYAKAGRPGWAALVPVYNELQVLWMVGRPWWWILLYFIPVVNLVFLVIVLNDLAKSFGKGTGMTVLLFFLPFVGFPILGFGDAKYQGPAALKGKGGDTPATPAGPKHTTPAV